MKRYFAVVDCNNFFVSCERLFDPSSRNKPTVVFSNNDGCIIARSNEAKGLGIKMGEPVFQCENILHFFDVKGFSTNFSLYQDISDRIFEILNGFALNIEKYSVDESFLELKEIENVDILNLGKNIKDTVFKEIGIPVSVGIGRSKTLAKLAIELAKKKDGVYLLSNDLQLLKTIHIKEVWGIGRGYMKSMDMLGIKSVFDFINTDSKIVLRKFGITGLRTWWELKGESSISLNTHQDIPKSISHTRSFKNPVLEFDDLLLRLYRYGFEIVDSMWEKDLLCKEISIFIRTSLTNHKPVYLSRTVKLDSYTKYIQDINPVVKNMLSKIYLKGLKYKKAGIIVKDIIPQKELNPLFADERIKLKNSNLAVHLINNRWNDAISVGNIYKSKEKSLNRSGEYTTNWNQLKVVF